MSNAGADEEMGAPSDSYVYIDDDGNAIAAEEETSYLMALGIRGHGEAAAASSSGDIPSETTYHEDPARFERERKLAAERLRAVLSGAVLEEAEDGSQDEGEPDVSGDEGDDDGGMGGYEYSRECTDEDDWELERILDRRLLRDKKRDSDYKDFYDDFGERKTGMLAAGRWEYLCKWKWYAEPTWETKELLEDEGYILEVRGFDDAATKCVPKAVLKWSDLHGALPSDSRRKEGEKTKAAAPVREVFFGNHFPLLHLAGSSVQAMASQFNSSGISMISYGSCAKKGAIDRFLERYSELSHTHRPVILYHGTQPANLWSIALSGLRVPRSHDQVKNGSTYGLGIYAAPSPETSALFCGGFENQVGIMFACIALVSNDDPNVRVCGSYCVVFYDSSLILPLCAVGFRQGTGLPRPVHADFGTLKIGGGSGPLVGKLSPAQGKALSKVRNQNILSINKLAKKHGL